MTKKVIHTENLSIGYTSKKSKRTIIENCDISLESGKLIALVGANGIGKSTLLKTITGIIPPVKGKIFLQGKLLQEYQQSELAQELSIVLTESLPPSNLTVYEIVALGRQPYTNWLGKLTNDDKNKVTEAITLTGITDFMHKKHYEISDGQLQKTLIARALAQDTAIIILDEPTTHLDLVHKVSLIKLLQKLTHETGKTILYSTHDIDLAIQLCDEMIVLTENKLVKDQPCNLIEQNIFNELFQNESVIFDKMIGKFKVV
ncbi:ABC transporter ATP-binding protein [Flavobacterium jejuense]|uniref:ABC transporter ATP-binding protein n=1 Tax=Flavobacterium jejuense TaxID=1544455 RepID=A0ABX0J1B3_9FLAO|nr:ABC transporter ATP-binding protein [Flavobacterium jejuense]NHN27720.1 ABC transporter ATP-binding protein [Flavobacterium jejuense]